VDSETSTLHDFNDKQDDLLIATLVMISAVLLVDLIALVMHNITVCRRNPEGIFFKAKIKYCKCTTIGM